MIGSTVIEEYCTVKLHRFWWSAAFLVMLGVGLALLANQWGGADPSCSNITIGDISTLIDNFFVTGRQSMALPDVCQRLYEREEL